MCPSARKAVLVVQKRRRVLAPFERCQLFADSSTVAEDLLDSIELSLRRDVGFLGIASRHGDDSSSRYLAVAHWLETSSSDVEFR